MTPLHPSARLLSRLATTVLLGLTATALAAAPTAPPPSGPIHSARAPEPASYPAILGKAIIREDDYVVPAPPERVFPLLCPSREYEWLPGWTCEVLRSRSGVAEHECVFRTTHPASGTMTWVVTRYEPSHCIEFTCFNTTNEHVMRLSIQLAPTSDGGTRLRWRRHWIATGPAGDRLVDEFDDDGLNRHTRELAGWLIHYIEHGRMPSSEPAAPAN